MKNFIKILLCFVLLISSAFSFTACEKKVEEPKKNEPQYEDSRFYDFESGLIGKKLRYKNIHKLNQNEILGTKECWKYVLEDTYVVELYAFHDDTEIYQSSLQANLVSVSGNPVPVKFNGTMALYVSDWQDERTDAVYEIFKSLK